ncbi:MAG: RNA polymerase sigma factor, partial [Planctomycetota bacterium]
MEVDRLLDHHGALRSLARSLVLDDATADDVVQEAWLAALKARDVETPESWMPSVVRNLAKRTFRELARRRKREGAVAAPEAATAESSIEALESQRRVIDAVLALDSAQRDVIVLRYFEELSAAEIGRRLDVPAATVRTRLKRGLAALRERLDRVYGDRRVWGLALLSLTQLRSGTLAAGAGASSSLVTLTGGVLMALAKAAPIAIVLVLVAVVIVVSSQPDLPPTVEEAQVSAGVPEEPSPRSESTVVPTPNPVSRSESEAAPTRPRSTRRLVGRVLDPDGRGVPEMTVRLRSAEQGAATDDEGAFSLGVDAKVVPGLLDLWVGSQSHEMVRPMWASTKRLVLVRDVSEASDESVEVGEIYVEPGGAIRGRVLLEGAAGTAAAEKVLVSVSVPGVPGDVHQGCEVDARGEFFIGGLPDGFVRVRPVARLGRGSSVTRGASKTVRIVAGRVTEVELDLARDARTEVQGLLLDSDGKPTRGRVKANWKGGFDWVDTDDGEFTFDVSADAEVTLKGRRGKGRAEISGVLPGDRGVVLQLEVAPHFTVDCRFEDGEVAEKLNFRWVPSNFPSGGETKVRLSLLESKGASRAIATPAVPSILRIESEFSKPAELGPVSSADAGEIWEIVLERTESVRIVVVDGADLGDSDSGGAAPIEGARVSLHTLYPASRSLLRNTLPVHVDKSFSLGTSDSNGVVALGIPNSLDSSRTIVAIVEKSGFARTVHDVQLDGEEQALELTRGGSLRGRLRLRADVDITGRVVAISNGDGKIYTQPVD